MTSKLSKAAAAMGAAKTPAKAAAARENGRKGGRPKWQFVRIVGRAHLDYLNVYMYRLDDVYKLRVEDARQGRGKHGYRTVEGTKSEIDERISRYITDADDIYRRAEPLRNLIESMRDVEGE